MALPRQHLLDALATAYVQAVAAAGGATIAVGRDFGVDGTLKHIVKVKERFVESGFPVEFQLKGTTSASIRKTAIVYDLKVRNHDLIVFREPHQYICSWCALLPEMSTGSFRTPISSS